MASEVGPIPVAPSEIAHSGRLKPGRMLLIDLNDDLKPVAVRYLDADRAQALPDLP